MTRPACMGPTAETASSPSQSHAALAETLARRPLDVYEALSYLDEVRAQFHNRPDVYSTFLDLLQDYKESRIGTATLIYRATALFTNHPQLIQRLEVFLPADCCLEGTRWRIATDALTPPVQPHAATEPPFNAAMDYVNRIKSRFADRPDKYTGFLDILLECQRNGPQLDVRTTLHDIAELFRGHEDLVEEFKNFIYSD